MKLRIRIRCRVVKVLTEFQGFVGSSTLHLSWITNITPHFFDVAILRNIKFLTCFKNLVETNAGELFLQDYGAVYSYCSSGIQRFSVWKKNNISAIPRE